MIKLLVPKSVVDEAKKYSRFVGEIRGSITQGDGNICGFISKKMVATYLNVPLSIEVGKPNIIYGGKRIGIHGTRTSVSPQPFHSCNITDSNFRNLVFDGYIFARVSYENDKMWIVGCCTREDLSQKSKFLRAGDPEGDNGYRTRVDCHNIKISSLSSLDTLLGLRKPAGEDQMPIVW